MTLRRVAALVVFATGALVLLAPRVARADTTPAAARATLYAFFATWCVPCRVELPHLERFHARYAGRGLVVILVAEDSPSVAPAIPAFLARHGVTAPWQLDSESALLERYNPSANLPFTVLVDASGKVTYGHAGFEPGDERALEAAIVATLDAAEVANARSRAAGATDRSVQASATVQSLGAYRTSTFDTQNRSRVRAGLARLDIAAVENVAPGASGQPGDTYRASARIDGGVIAMDAATDVGGGSGEIAARDMKLARVTLAGELGAVALTAGDDYASFGHGVTLSLRKIDPLGLDTSLRGGRVDLRGPSIEAKILAGWANPQSFDPLTLTVRDHEIRDFLAGSEVTIELGELGQVAPYVLHASAPAAASDGGDVSWNVAGSSTTLARGDLRVAAEAAGGTRDGLALAGRETAWAGYAAVHIERGAVAVLVDGKAYRHWAIGRGSALLYHEPPTLEREDQEVPGNQDVAGGRVRVDWRAARRLNTFGNLLAYRYADSDGSPIDGSTALHGYGGGDVRLGRDDDGSLGLALGYRRELDPAGARRRARWHVDVDAAWRLPRALAVTAKWNHREEVERVLGDKSFRRGLVVVGLARTGWAALSALYGYSTEFASRPTHYPGGELLVHLGRGGSLRLFGGRQGGGIVCVSGSCRSVPPFSGARLDLTWSI